METGRRALARPDRLAALDGALKAMFAEAARATPPELLSLLDRLQSAPRRAIAA
ncbi:MAG TPA: hypothetical protein VMU93_03440 [Caulobacteraceae bacterium]|nr:hypothetical protein [Caulobacteraceae bacterium]